MIGSWRRLLNQSDDSRTGFDSKSKRINEKECSREHTESSAELQFNYSFIRENMM